VTLILILAGAYLAINVSWSRSPESARLALAMLLLIVVAVHFTMSALEGNDADVLRAILAGLYTGMLIGGTVMFFETLSDHWLRRTLMSLVPVLRPKPADMLLEDGRVAFIQQHLMNRNVAAMTFLFWPTMLAAVQLGRRYRYIWLSGLFPAAGAIIGLGHATSKVAFIGAALVFAVLPLSPRVMRRLLAAGWIAGIALVVPMATLAYQSQLYLSPWLAHSGQHRIVIWGTTSQLIAKAPLLGAGIDTARALNERHRDDAPFAPGSDFRMTTGAHSHNVYLQAWYEAGLFGAVLMCALGLAMLASIARGPPQGQPYLYATFVSGALLGSASFGLWQPWFMAAFALTGLLAVAGASLAVRPQTAGHVSASGSAHP
jgi:O-antigen ligase